MDIPVDVEYDDIDTGREGKAQFQPGVRVTCQRCRNQEECLGTTPESIQRACDRLIIGCPRREQNHYYAP